MLYNFTNKFFFL